MSVNEMSSIIKPQPNVPSGPNVAPSSTPQAPNGDESVFQNLPSASQIGGLEIPDDVIDGWKEQFPEIFGDDDKTSDLEKTAPEGDDIIKQEEENETEKFYDDMKELTPDEREELLNSCSSEDKQILEELFKYIDEYM